MSQAFSSFILRKIATQGHVNQLKLKKRLDLYMHLCVNYGQKLY